jgi:hypothetical protein
MGQRKGGKKTGKTGSGTRTKIKSSKRQFTPKPPPPKKGGYKG